MNEGPSEERQLTLHVHNRADMCRQGLAKLATLGAKVASRSAERRLGGGQ